MPKSSSNAGVGVFRVAIRAPLVALNTYAEPPVASMRAPTATLLPDKPTEYPNKSSSAGVGSFRVAIKAPVVALNTYAEPGFGADALDMMAPTATVLPNTATEKP